MAGRPDPLIAEARDRWNRCDEAEDKQRKRILAAKLFRSGNQWPESIKIAREGGNAIQGQSPQPPRPCLVVDRLSQPCRQVSNAIKTASVTFTVLPAGRGADEDTADIFQGILRRIHNEARAESPVEWAADQAVEGGIGWFRLRTEYVYQAWTGEPSPEMFDQELRLERITNNLTVYCDPSATKPTRSDAQFMFVTEDLSKEEFRRRWPKADVRGLEEFAATGDCPKEWVTKDNLRIAEYWRVTYENQPWYELADGTVRQGVAPKGADVRQERVIRVPLVKGSKINAFEQLEPMAWVGSRIPLIPVLGEELNVDGQSYLRGVIEQGMDAQRMVNYTYSGAVEIFALGSKGAPRVAAGSVAQYKEIWQTRNIYNHAYLPWDPFDDLGRPMPAPADQTAEPPIQAAVALMQASEEAIQATTALVGPSDQWKQLNTQSSGSAIQAVQQQSDLATANYMDNVVRALVYAADQLVEVLPKITRPGQIVHLLGLDDEPDAVMVGQPFTKDAHGQPQASPPDVTPALAALSKGLHQFYDLNNGRYSVTADLGKATATRAQEGAAALGQLIPHLPPNMATAVMPDYVEQLSFPGAHEIAAKLRGLEPPTPDALKNLPPELQQMVGGLQQQLQQATQQLQTDGAKQQATMVKANIDAQMAMQKAQLDNQTKLQIAQINAQAGLAEAEAKAGNADLALRVRILEQMIGVAKEERLARLEGFKEQASQHHEAATQAADHAHDHAMVAHQAIADAAVAAAAPQGGGTNGASNSSGAEATPAQ